MRESEKSFTMSCGDVCTVLGISPVRVLQLAREGKIKSRKVAPKRRLYDATSVARHAIGHEARCANCSQSSPAVEMESPLLSPSTHAESAGEVQSTSLTPA